MAALGRRDCSSSQLAIAIAVAVVLCSACVPRVAATKHEDCPSTCLGPYGNTTQAGAPNTACLRMCHVCLNTTSKGCTSYFLPYFYGNEYSKHFACWETCPLPTWAWAVIGVSAGLALLLMCHCVWYCAYRRKQNREAAMQMYNLTHGGNVHMVVEQQAVYQNHSKPSVRFQDGPGGADGNRSRGGPAMIAGPALKGARGAIKSTVQAVKNIQQKLPMGKPGARTAGLGGLPHAPSPLPSYLPPPAPSPATLPPNPSFTVNSSRSLPRHEGGGWGVRTNPSFQKLEQAERASLLSSNTNPYSSNMR